MKKTCLLIALLASALQAQGPEETWHLSGFGTLGVAGTSTHKAGYFRDAAQPDDGLVDRPNAKLDSRLGLQLNAKASETLQATFQVVSKYRYDGSFTPELTRAYLAWNPVGNLQLNLGRVGLEQILNSNSRDVGYAYLWVRPNVERFCTSPVNYVDGLDLAQTFSLAGQATMRVKGFAGILREKVPIGQGTSAFNYFSFSGSPAAGLLWEWQDGPFQARVSYSHLRIRNPWPPAIQLLVSALDQYSAALQDPGLARTAQSLNFQGEVNQTWDGTLQWEKGPLQVQTGLTRATSNRPLFRPDTWSGYASLGYRLDTLVPYAVYSRSVSDRPPMPYLGLLPALPGPVSQLLVPAIQGLLPYCETDQTTLSAGLRWDFRPNMDLKFQVDSIDAHDCRSTWRTLQPGWDGKATVFSLTCDFVFGRGR